MDETKPLEYLRRIAQNTADANKEAVGIRKELVAIRLLLERLLDANGRSTRPASSIQ